MAVEGIQNYVDMAAGLTKATRAKARAAAKSLLATAGLEDVAADATDRATRLAEEVLAASKANRELMNKLVASEVDKAAARLGFVRTDELEELRRELSELRMSMAHAAARDEPGPDAGSTTGRFAAPDLGIPDPPSPVETLVEPDEAPTIEPIDDPVVGPAIAVKRAAAKKAAKTASVKKAPAKKAAAKKAPAKQAAAKKAPSEQAAVTAPAKKAAAPKAAASTTASAPGSVDEGSDTEPAAPEAPASSGTDQP